MNCLIPKYTNRRVVTLATLALALNISPLALAQENPAEAGDLSSAIKKESENQAKTLAQEKDEMEVLSPFLVSGDNTRGYWTKQSVAGSRSVKDIIDLPTSVSVINAEQLADHNAADMSDAIHWGAAGVTQDSNNGEQFNIRGFRTENVTRDGQNQTGIKAQLYDIESIEVIKGPTNMLIGVNSFIGGAVNLVTRQPTATPRADVKLTAAQHNYYRLAANASGPLVKSPDFSLNYRVTVGGLTYDTVKEPLYARQKFIGGGLAFLFPKSKASLTVNASYLRNDSFYYPQDFVDIVKSPPNVGAVAVLNQYSTEDFAYIKRKHVSGPQNHSYIQGIYTDQLTENSNLKIQYQLTHLRSPEGWAPLGNQVEPDNVTLTRYLIVGTTETFSQLGQVDYQHVLPLKWAKFETTIGTALTSVSTHATGWGNYMQSIDVRNPNWAADDAWFAPANIASLPRDVGEGDWSLNNVSGSYYLQEYISSPKQLVSVLAGWRKNYPHAWGVYKDNLTGISTRQTAGTNKVQYKYGIVIKPRPWLAVYYTDAANVTFQGNSFIDVNTPGDRLGGPVPDQLGLLKEAGIKINRQLNESTSLHFTAARYYVALTNVAGAGFLKSGIPGTIYTNRKETRGWEFESIASHLTSNGAVSVIATLSVGDSNDGSGKQAVDFVPRKWSIWGKYAWNNGGLKGLWVGGGTSYLSKRRGYYEYYIVRPQSYSAVVGYQLGKHWNFQFNLDNLEDKRYIIQVGAPGQVETAGGFNPRMLVEYKF